MTSAMIHVYSDDSVSVLSGATEMGQGSHTILAQIAAEEMGVPLAKVRLVGSDTAITPFERSTGASRTTTLMGRAVLEACREAIAQLKTMAADALSVPEAELVEESGGLRHGDTTVQLGRNHRKIFPPQGHQHHRASLPAAGGRSQTDASVLGNRRGGRGNFGR